MTKPEFNEDEGYQVFEFTENDLKHMILGRLEKAGTEIKNRKIQLQTEYGHEGKLYCMKIILGPTEDHHLEKIFQMTSELLNEVKNAKSRTHVNKIWKAEVGQEYKTGEDDE